MISQKKLEANRRNAQKSTGPKTAEGKAISSQNGLTHGLTSKKYPILPGEDEAEYQRFHDAMLRDLKPRGIMQREIVDELVMVRWRLKRLPKIEAEMMHRKQQTLADEYERSMQYCPDTPLPDLDPIHLLTDQFTWDGNCSYSNMELYRQRMQRSMHTLLRELRKLREETGGEDEEELTAEPLPRDTGLRPVQTQQQTGEERFCKTEPKQHGPEARVTAEQMGKAAQDAICKTEPTADDNSCPEQEMPSPDEPGIDRLNPEPAGIQSRDPN